MTQAPAQAAPPFGRFLVSNAPRGFGLGVTFATREAAVAAGAAAFAGASFVTARVDRLELDFAQAAAELAPVARLHLLEQLAGVDHHLDPRELAPPPTTGEDPRLLFALENVLASYFGPSGALSPRGWVPAAIQVHRIP